jgi:putative transposase
MITGSTLHKVKWFNTPEKLDILHDTLLTVIEDYGWDPLAWSIFPNHYHLLAISPQTPLAVKKLTGRVHSTTARLINKLDESQGRSIWFRSWDTRISYEKSVMARIAYVHRNAVKHGIVSDPEAYKWCSAGWFLQKGDRSFVNSVLSFNTDDVNVMDDC